METLNVTVVQPLITWHNFAANLQYIKGQISEISHTDLIVLPEMWSSGFTMKAHQFYSSTPEALEAMKLWSVEYDCAVIGTLITKVEESYYNRSYVIVNGDIKAYYDKVHLFGFSGEDRFFKKGKEKCIFEYKKWRLSINICYDLRFPVWSRNTDDYDVLIYSANWPHKRINAWDVLLKGRAIENQAFVLGSNCVGEDAWHNKYLGHSAIINFDGSTLVNLKGKSGVLTAELNKTELKSYRDAFPFLKDRDSFSLI